MKKQLRKVLEYRIQIRNFFFITTIIGLFVLLVSLRVPEMIVGLFGEEYTYLAVFLVGALGGVSTFTTVTYFGIVASFADAGLNIYLLAIVGGLGSAIGDTLFYFFGRHGRVVVNKRAQKYIAKVRVRLEKTHKAYIPVIVYLYAGFTPLPNEFMTIPVGLSGFNYRWVIIPLILGNITVTLMTLLFVPWFFGLF